VPALADMLDAGSDQEISNVQIREQVEIIEHTLDSFGAPASVVEINQGPTITQYGVEPSFIEMRSGKRTKVKVGKIASLADDLALALAARSIRIQAPVPGQGYVGIEVPNTDKAVVSLRDVLESEEFQKINSPLRIGLGQNVAGQPIATDLTKMPHLLIAGTTGAGKSVCVNGIIACLLLQNTPENLKLVMVDPKRVELTGYNGIPHLIAPVVVDMERVVGTLQWAMREMDNRYQRLADIGARNIIEYNKKAPRQSKEKMPYIVIIVDELADLMMLSPEDTERGITRLAQMSRATGIHMIIATQRPSVDVVTGLIKANFPARIAFAVASSTDSRVILDSTGAERLLGQGDMLFQSPDAAAPVRMQGCFVNETELHNIIEYWRRARIQNRQPAKIEEVPASPTGTAVEATTIVQAPTTAEPKQEPTTKVEAAPKPARPSPTRQPS
jgi:S-DNA-T family DNA segregation ATPase FtsK/SpoIIIE